MGIRDWIDHRCTVVGRAGAVIIVLAALWACSTDENEIRLREATTLFEQHQYVQARQALEALLASKGDDPRVPYLLGQIAELQGDAPTALSYYSRVLSLRKDHMEARIKSARLFLEMGDLDQAEKVLNYAKEFRPNDKDLLSTEAAIYDRRGDSQRAIALATQLLQQDPDTVDARVLLNALYARTGNLAEGERLLREGLVRQPANTKYRYALANNLLGQNRLSDAEALLTELVSREPDILPYQARLAELYARSGRLDNAEDILRKGAQREPGDERRVLALSRFLAQYRGLFVAEEELVSAIFSAPKTIGLRMALAELYERMLNLDGAERVYREIADQIPNTPPGNHAALRAADLTLQFGDSNSAAELVNRVLAKSPEDADALLLRGKVELARRDYGRAIDDFRNVLGKRPGSLDVLGMLVRAYVASGNSDMAENGLRNALKISPEHVGMRLELVQLLVVENRFDDAAAELDIILANVPNEPRALTLKVDMAVAKKDWERAESLAEVLRDLHPDLSIGHLQLGNIYFTREMYEQAADAYRMGLKRFPLDYNALSSLINAILMKEGVPAAKRYLEGFLEAYPNHPTGYQILGELYLQQSEHTKAEAAYIKAYQLNPTWIEPYKSLARLYEIRGEPEAVVQTYLNGLAIIPDSIQLTVLLADAYDSLGKTEDAIGMYEELVKSRPYLDIAANNLAQLLLDSNASPENLDRVGQLLTRFEGTDVPAYQDTLAWYHFKAGRIEKAKELLEPITKQPSATGAAQYHLAMIYIEMGRADEAKNLLQKAVTSPIRFRGYSSAKATLSRLKSRSTGADAQAPAPRLAQFAGQRLVGRLSLRDMNPNTTPMT